MTDLAAVYDKINELIANEARTCKAWGWKLLEAIIAPCIGLCTKTNHVAIACASCACCRTEKATNLARLKRELQKIERSNQLTTSYSQVIDNYQASIGKSDSDALKQLIPSQSGYQVTGDTSYGQPLTYGGFNPV